MSDLVSGLAGVTAEGGPMPLSYAVQKVTWDMSDTVFNYTPSAFDLDGALRSWSARQRVNASGRVPVLYNMESRAGAALSLVGFLSKVDDVSSPVGVYLTSEAFRIMEPVLLANTDLWKPRRVTFYIAAIDYDLQTGEIVVDRQGPLETAQRLGLSVYTNINAEDIHETATLAATTQCAAFLFDGVRGSRQAITLPTRADKYPKLNGTGKIQSAWTTINSTYSVPLSPFQYLGKADAATIIVSSLPVAEALVSSAVGAVMVRELVPFDAQGFQKSLPASTTKIIVLGSFLASCVQMAVNSHFGLGHGPTIQVVKDAENKSPVKIAEELSIPLPDYTSGFRVYAADSSVTAAATGALAIAGRGSAYTVWDSNVLGGSVAVEFQTDASRAGLWPLDKVKGVVVADVRLLAQWDVTENLGEDAFVVVLSTEKDWEKYAPHLRWSAVKRVLSVDAAAVAGKSQGAEGRDLLFVAQAALLLGSGVDTDTAASRIVQASGPDTELVASVVTSVVSNVKENLIVASRPEGEAASNTVPPTLLPRATAFGSISKTPAEIPDATELSTFELQKHILFKEAYHSNNALRPDIPVKTAVARVKTNERVTPLDYDRNIFHLELDISGTGLTYAIGEALGVHAPNGSQDVAEFLDWYGLNPDETVGVPHRDSAELDEFQTVFQTFRDNLDLFGKVPKRFYEGIVQYATDAGEKARLEHLASPAGADDLRKLQEEEFVDYSDVLREFKSARVPLPALLQLIGPLKRREYSIASSQNIHPNEVHLLIVVVDWKTKSGKVRYGQCSKHLSELAAGAEVVVSVKPSVMKLPKDPSKPIIMAGLGTGLAPFKAFLEEKMWQKAQGEDIGDVYLFLGSRHKREEYLYGEYFEAFKAAGILTHIGAAFSRDQPEKIYIQHRIQEASKQLADAFVRKGGTFYLCGPTWPVPDVSAALCSIITGESGEPVDEVKLIEDLKDAERYILEVY